MDDLISRQAAIDALGEKPLVWDDLSDFDLGKAAQWSDDVDAIKALPSAQPETHEKRTETHACDCVSGVAAIVAAIEAVDEWDGGYNVQRANMIRDAIKALPSAQPQWISVTKEEMFKAGYEGREIRFRVDGRLFAIRELAQ